eukprot:1159206-Pelagomonas_calceolata.AAC.6
MPWRKVLERGSKNAHQELEKDSGLQGPEPCKSTPAPSTWSPESHVGCKALSHAKHLSTFQYGDLSHVQKKLSAWSPNCAKVSSNSTQP